MKCLCCNQFFDDRFSLKEHYITCHNVDENSHFFRKLFTRGNFSVRRKCFRCDYFYMNRREKKRHKFLTPDQMGGRLPVEDKPLKRTIFDENLQRYCISFSEHGNYYNFFDSRELVSDFWTVFENVFVP